MMKKSNKTTKYEVTYYTLEPSYYEHSEKVYVKKTFTDRKEAFTFVEEAKKYFPAQIVLKAITEQHLLDLRDTDNYQENLIG
jgi:hypothetical protein